ncbi:1-phosphofructokinase family hexose kinase [Pseudorhodoplanes sp.]|uniref:1-phosphofructokinase family hexose kinase n=1 Tax=Pseudorhodoplanes sp. TaxID=1934341 RepID=UPI003D09D7AC
MGGAVTSVYPIGGISGRLLQRLVEDEGLAGVTFQVAGEARESFTVLETESGAEYRFVLPGPSLTQSEWRQALDTLEGLSERPDILVMSGSLPPGVPHDFYAQAARAVEGRGGRVILDSSGPALAAGKGLFLIKPNLRELRELTGEALEDETSWVAACSSLVTSGKVEAVALTLGEKGALLVSRNVTLRAPALPISPASTVGAGDSFLGALVWALASGRDLEEAFRYGIAAGSAALLAPGTQLCRHHDVERLYSQVIIHPL